MFHRTLALLLAACAAAPAAHATFISFDERQRHPPASEEGDWSIDPITTEYDALGVRIEGAYLQDEGQDPVYSKSQYILGSNYVRITFTNAILPTYVSLSFSSPQPSFLATVTAIGRNGEVLGAFDTGGSYWSGPDEGWVQDTPYKPHSFASFHSATGISHLNFGVWLGTRNTAKFDNLYFGNVPAVPEPASLAMLAAGLGVVGAAWRRRKALPAD
jgi:hypothetical protein